MSTKIYDGFKLRGYKSLDQAFQEMKVLRDVVQRAAKEESARLLAELAVNIYDKRAIKKLFYQGDFIPQTPPRSAYSLARDEIDIEVREAARTRARCYYDLECTLSFGITNDKTVIGILHCSNKRLKDEVWEHPHFEEYGWWDSTDRPEGVTARAWAKRKVHWDEVLPEGYPAQEMFQMSFVPEYTIQMPEREELERQLQLITFEQRLQRVVEMSTMDKAVVELNLDSPGKIIQFRMRGDEYTTRYEAEKLLLSEKLKQEVTLEDLAEKI